MDAVIECNSTCGDGSRAGREECDDGNTESGDGCSSNCVFEDVVRYSVPANATWECAMIPANTTSSGNQLRGAVTCYRDLCQRSQLFKDIQSAKAISQGLTAVVSTVIPFALFRECNHVHVVIDHDHPVLFTHYYLQAIVGAVAAGTGTALASASSAGTFGAGGG